MRSAVTSACRLIPAPLLIGTKGGGGGDPHLAHVPTVPSRLMATRFCVWRICGGVARLGSPSAASYCLPRPMRPFGVSGEAQWRTLLIAASPTR